MREDWTKLTIGEFCTITKGLSPIQKTPAGAHPLITTSAPSSSDSYQFDGEAVCVPMVSSTGHGHASLKRVHYASGKFAVANILSAVQVIDPEVACTQYLWLYLQHFKDFILVPRMQGTANVSLSQKELAKVEVELPPIEAQRRAADLIGSIDDVIRMSGGPYLESLETLRLSILTLIFSGEYEIPESYDVDTAVQLEPAA